MKFCNNCKSEVEDEARFCATCGSQEFTQSSSSDDTLRNMFEKPSEQVGEIDSNSGNLSSGSNLYDSQPDNMDTQNPYYFNNTPPSDTNAGVYNQPYQAPVIPTVEEDKPNIGLRFLAWFVPLFGIIYYFAKKKEKPASAKSYGLAALISIIVNTVLSIIVCIIAFATTTAMITGVSTAVDDINSDTNWSYSIDADEESDDYSDSLVIDSTDDDDSTTTTVSNNISKLSTDWESEHTVLYDGKALVLPVKYSTFLEVTDISIPTEYENFTLDAGDYKTISFYINEKNYSSISLEFYNSSDSVTTIENCVIDSIEVDINSKTDGLDKFAFANGLKVGDTVAKEDLVSAFGEPDYDYSYSNSYSLTWYGSDTVWNCFSVSAHDGIIDDIELEFTE